MTEPPGEPRRSRPWLEIGCGALAGLAVGLLAVIAIGLGGIPSSLPLSEVLGTAAQYLGFSFVVGAAFGFWRPALSWRWGLLLGWGLLSLVVLFAGAAITCTPPGCTEGRSDAVAAAVILGCVAALCAGAAVGSLRDRAT